MSLETSEAGPLRAGAAVTTITPPLGTELAGLFEPRVSTSVESDLTARALVLDNGTVKFAMVVCDLLYLSAEVLAAIRKRVAEVSDIQPQNVMVSVTHTHAGPYVTNAGAPWVTLAADYLEGMALDIAESVIVANAQLVPATVATGATTVAGICFNRRYHMSDGTVVMNPAHGNPDIIAPAGPTDPTVTAMLVEDTEGTPIALWANLSLHYVGTDSSNVISADYYGEFAQTVERWLGQSVVGMLTNAASGDTVSVDRRDPAPTQPRIVRSRRLAATVAGAALAVTMSASRTADPDLDMVTAPLDVKRWPVTARDAVLARQILDTPADQEPPVADFSYVTGQALPRTAYKRQACGTLALTELPSSQQVDLVLVRIGDLALAGLPAEVFVEFGLEIKRRSPAPLTAIVGLCGPIIGYLPTLEAFAQGGYETWRHGVSWTAPGTGEAMVEVVAERLPDLFAAVGD